MSRFLILPFLLVLLSGCQQPNLPSLYVAGVSKPLILLNGNWEVNLRPAGEYWRSDSSNTGWDEIRVPGECMMQGFAIRHDEPFAYRKKIVIPGDYDGKTVKLRFDGVYNYARVWVNGQFVRDHYGGFTRWECDITPFISPGKEALITLEVTDRADDISYGSGYAKHPIGGILRDVSLLALPAVYPEQLTFVTDLDDNYKHANLIISGKLSNMPVKGRISLKIADPGNNTIPLQNNELMLSDTGAFSISNGMRSPRLWDAEHPNLYTLTISYMEDEKLVYSKTVPVGFREVKVEGNKLLVNGMEVKLRGACRHDIHPLLGRVSTPEYELRDVRLAKEANMNFIRTSHYPPTENFLLECDKRGIYVEDETAVCFVGSHRTEEYYPGASESDTAFTFRYLSQLEEMVTSHRNHPSVILWSVGNENAYGSNFKLSYDWVKANDPTRPVIFSYPGLVPDSIQAYDILSMHYPGIAGNMNQYGKITDDFGYSGMPVIFDEWAHVACYNNFTIKEDPNIRDFWGRSLDSMWTRVFEAEGGLGGAIWGMIDETFMLPDTLPGYTEWWGKIDPHVIPAEYSGHTIGYGEWGIVDTWRRKKPEFWNTKKAYSPFKVLQTTFATYQAGDTINLPVHNRFDHTNFNELRIRYKHDGQNLMADPINLAPHQRGVLKLPIKEWTPGEQIYLEARDRQGRPIDQYILRLSMASPAVHKEEQEGSILCLEEDSNLVVVCENGSRIFFDKSTGLMQSLQKNNDRFTLAGPNFNLRTRGKEVIYSYHEIKEYTEWELSSFSWQDNANQVIIRTQGICSNILPVDFTITITPQGLATISYAASGLPEEYIRELGVMFRLDTLADAISWERDTYWSYYPEGHLSAAEGNTSLYPESLKTYRTNPTAEWALDSKSFYYDGTADESPSRLTFMAKATKENIRDYSLYKKKARIVSVTGQGDVHCRLAKNDEQLMLFISNTMDYVDLSWGNYQHNILASDSCSNVVQLIF